MDISAPLLPLPLLIVAALKLPAYYSALSKSISDVEQMRTFRHPEGSPEEPKHVMILIRVCDIYTNPSFYIFINP